MTEPSAGGRGWRRLALTLLLLALPLGGQLIAVPGIDPDAELSRMAGTNTSLVALGLTPMLSAFWLVELAALVVPRWRKLRHGFPDGRVRLVKSVVVLALVLAAFQAFGVAMMLDASELAGDVNHSLVVVSLVAGTSLLMLAAQQIERLGLINGVLGVSLVTVSGEIARDLSQLELPTEPLALVAVAVALVLPCVATWAALQSFEPRPGARSLQLSMPSSSMHPALAVAALLSFPAALAQLLPVAREQLEELSDVVAGPYQLEIRIGVAWLLGAAMAFLLHQPGVVAKRVRAIDAQSGLTAPRVFRTVLRTLPWAGAFLLVILVAEQVLISSGFNSLLAQNLALVSALALDGRRAFRAQRAGPSLVCVWEEHRPYLVPQLLAAAQRHEVELHVTGVAATSLLRFFAPYAAIKLWSPAAGAAKAREVLGELLIAANEPKGTPPASAQSDAPKVASAPSSTRLLLSLGAVAAALAVVVRFADPSLFMARGEVVNVRADFQISAVDDSTARLSADSRDLPAGIAIFTEYLFPRADAEQRVERPYARLVLQPGESLEQAQRRIEPWVQSLQLPPGTRMGWEALAAEEWSAALIGADGELAEAADGYRSYFLTGEPILVARQVQSVALSHWRHDDMPAIDFRLTPEGSERFAAATERLVDKRMAISSGGLVRSALFVESPIANGRLQLSLGPHDDPAAAEHNARRFLERVKAP